MLARSNVASKAAARVVSRAASVRPALAARRLHSGRGGQRRQQYRQGAGAKAALGAAVGAGAVLAAAALASQDEEQQQALVAQAAAPAVDWDAVRNDIVELLEDDSHDDGSYGPILVRLAWHASGTAAQDGSGGSNGATMRFHPECAFAANAGLETARKRLEPVKAKHPGLSYADLWTFAGKVAIEEMAGPEIPWGPGRTDADGGKACPPDGRLPDAAQGSQHVRDIFYRMGFNDREIVALIGAHALGRCHTGSSGYDGPWTRAPTTFSNEYYRLLLEDKWSKRRWNGPEQYQNKDKDLMMLPADMALAWDSEFRRYVELYAADEELFFKDFAAAFGKLLALNVPASQPKKGLWKRIFG